MSKERRDNMMQMPEGAAAAYASEDGTVNYVLDPFLLDMRWKRIGTKRQEQSIRRIEFGPCLASAEVPKKVAGGFDEVEDAHYA